MHNIEKVNFKDSVEIKKLLMNSKSIAVSKGKLLQEVLMHIDNKDSIAMKITKDGRILGVWLSKEFESHTSLSYFFISEELRLQKIVLEFFMKCIVLINKDKPLLIETNDTTGFEKYIEPVAGKKNIYSFKGFRQWVK